MSYGRGLLSEFPGVPEGIVDVIPVDLVVAAICARRGPRPPRPTHGPTSCRSRRARSTRCATDASSTSCRLVHRAPDLRRSRPGHRRCRVVLPRTWPRAEATQPGQDGHRPRRAGAVAAPRARQAGRVRRHPRREARARRTRARLRRALRRVRRMRSGLRARSTARTVGFARRRRPAPTYPFDPRAIDWDSYVHDIHLPSIVAQARVKTTPGARQAQPRAERLREQVLSPDRHLAAFDLENTLIASNVVASYSWLATRRLTREDRARFVAKQLLEGPSLLKLDRLDRSDFLRFFYRRYEALRSIRSTKTPPRCSAISSSPSRSPPRIRRVREHRRTRPPHRARSPARSTSSSSPSRRSSTTSSPPHGHHRPTCATGSATTAASRTCHPPAKPATKRWSTTPTRTACR